MENLLQLTPNLFFECNWICDLSHGDHHGYPSISSSLRKCSEEMLAQGNEERSRALSVLANAASMMLAANSINEPFRAYFQDFQAGRRSAIPEDFTGEELAFFEGILDGVDDLWLKARLADLLWLVSKPKNPEHAKAAIDSYVSHDIDDETWNSGVDDCLERAARLSMQIRDYDRLNGIKNKLFSAFFSDYPKSKFMMLWIGKLLDKLNIDSEIRENIAVSLQEKANNLTRVEDFHSARSYFELASKKFKQCLNEKKFIESLISIADCFEAEADSRSEGSSMVANSFYENSVQALRRIPTKHRDSYGIDSKIEIVRTKISVTGSDSLNEMVKVSTPKIDISDMVKQSIEHVAGKPGLEEALIYFTGLFSGPNYKNLSDSAKITMEESLIGRLFGSSHMSRDGRVIAKTPAMNLNLGADDPANQAALYKQIQQHFSIEVQLVVEGQILPALRQLLMEHRFTKEFIVAICQFSPIVPQSRETLLGHALWLGFEYEFGAAIHLLCPQLENIVRSQLKKVGAHTSNIDKFGIENENGLSTLMEMPETLSLFGENLTFEIKGVFTEALGFNLRNEVAHGLLDDSCSSSMHAIYAWWMTLRLVVNSILGRGFKSD